MKSVPDLLTVFWSKYISGGFELKDIADNPYDQFESWVKDASINKSGLPDAMNLAMEEPHGMPDGRVVILRGFYDRKFVFFTNYDGGKRTELKNNSIASMTLFWSQLSRQVRIVGEVYAISEEESDKFLQGHNYLSEISPPVSKENKILENNDAYKKSLNEKETVIKNPVQHQISWRGFYLSPRLIEFCQGRKYLFNYRIRFRLEKDNSWNIKRLFPLTYYG